MEPSYDSSEWASDDESQRISQKHLCKPRPKRVCQVPGCTADLEAIGKPYCSVKRICPIHMKADIIPVRNQIMRFCQHAPQQQQQQGALRAPPSSAASGGTTAGRGGSHRSEMMSRLQSRLQVLQSQMEDMQLMLGLLQEA
ncbi:hypothetical protein OEZ86_002258 [Tetradesmus obliquus]|nr:hypothetical protein OEZ86_002258 [Tetradesmus obliquus]